MRHRAEIDANAGPCSRLATVSDLDGFAADEEIRAETLRFRGSRNAVPRDQALELARREEVPRLPDQTLDGGQGADAARTGVELADEQGAAGTQHPHRLGERLLGPFEVVDGIVGDHGVEGGVRERHPRRVAEHGPDTFEARRPTKHRRARVEYRHRTTDLGRKQGREMAGAATQIEDLASSFKRTVKVARDGGRVVGAPTSRQADAQRHAPVEEPSRHTCPAQLSGLWHTASTLCPSGPITKAA